MDLDLKSRGSQKKPATPSKLLAIFALCVAIALPYFLVKTFRNKQPKNLTIQSLSLPKPQQEIPSEDVDEDSAELEEPQYINSISSIPPAILNHEKTRPSTKLTNAKQSKPEDKWETVITKKGDTLAGLFRQLGISRKTLTAVLHNNPHAKTLTSIKPGQQLRFVIHDQVLEKLIVPLTPTQSLLVYRSGQRYLTQISSRKVTSHHHYLTATIQGSLYNTAKRMSIPYKLIQQMTDLFNWEIDFSKDVHAGDQFTIVYEALYVENKRVGVGEIVAVTYTSRGKIHQAIRYKNKAGDYNYFTPQGVSLRKAFTRYPLKFSHISSTFSLARMHPILHRKRPHKGVDLAAPIGTPIHAVGDGIIDTIGRHSGYGNMIKIIHNKKYSTVYAHMLKFQKGLSKGDRVKRGQIIGYVGQTGLASGPHCHYEFHINKKPKNPTTVDLPRAASVPAREMASFTANASALLAQMKLFEEAQFAASGKKAVKTA
ncbi:peptidoglycan DD-metalloendopeptidase family protein [Legionella nagasakiensis]|uniref:peptidoglycan DD-metalloendopeptidase family protein n=1 Tax=Legionella nagasakiensis TaxID=535290 RepID=UPI001054ABD8|nr:peptidoglycan DD-metalloendopeptidase family protein [Legionella nagasakiensis]